MGLIIIGFDQAMEPRINNYSDEKNLFFPSSIIRDIRENKQRLD